ncbi:glycosyltransferase family 4 protein [Methylobacterium sp. NEAU 140]|uniref:glycosyltransferase family 4 protein n=1 Tax=Methylobacterium sp. NEAU 140 TaxID=3064945 RepID=UPI00273397BF|nr:glycosyltransferase family 4 protein [Methylobacterium sp. NEAU 140]MDP4025998.1 glycosyltransferase family 4 protein [Methylobacterium sp. NEAU 140]
MESEKTPGDFDPHTYLLINPDVAAARVDPAEHYLRFGRSEGREYKFPEADNVPEAGADTGPGKTETQDVDREMIARSGLFDDCWYRIAAGITDETIDPINHYVDIGERSGLNPSKRFDAQGYRYINDDIGKSKYNALVHYLRFGRSEGRARSILDKIVMKDVITTERQFIVVLFHECSRTGAPILGWNLIEHLKQKYRVIALVKATGPIIQSIKKSAEVTIVIPDGVVLFPAQCYLLAKRLYEMYKPKYAIANSVETRCFVPSFEEIGIPTLSLVHEFADYEWIPPGSLNDLFKKSTHVVFSTDLVARNCVSHYPCLLNVPYEILAQGRSSLPIEDAKTVRSSGNPLGRRIEMLRNKDNFIVAGMGRVTHRKGVDLFIETAFEFYKRYPIRNIFFIWIGGWDESDTAYAEYQQKVVREHGLGDKVHFFPEMYDLDYVYSRIDLLYLSSRLDPMPNVAIDATCHGIPIICFRRASGIAELFEQSCEFSHYVVERFDVEAAADAICKLSETGDAKPMKARMKDFSRLFQMENYVKKLDNKMIELSKAARRDYEE